jgi:uncharacterized protein YbcC (UPF0753/DUF2309 family)
MAADLCAILTKKIDEAEMEYAEKLQAFISSAQRARPNFALEAQNNELRCLNTRTETLREIRTLVVSLRETPL